MNLKQLAESLGTTGKAMAREFGLPLDASKDVPLSELNITQEQLDDEVEHQIGHTESNLKYYLYFALALWGLLFLAVFGRPGTISILITVVLSLVIGLFIYRLYCQLICPFGFLSWIVEHISIYRIKIDHDTCINCGACDKACPNEAAINRVDKKPLKQDCFSCARCLDVCPVDCIEYGNVLKR